MIRRTCVAILLVFMTVAPAALAAEKEPAPDIETLFDEVYADMPWHLREQLEELKAAMEQGHPGPVHGR